MFGRKIKTIFIIPIILIVIILSYYIVESKDKKIHYGVQVSGIDVSKLSKEDAKKKIGEIKSQENKNAKLVFKEGNQTYYIPYEDLGYTLDIDSAVNKAYGVGRSKLVVKNFFDIIIATVSPREISIDESYDAQKVSQTINYLVEKVYKEPINSEVSYTEEGGFTFTKSEQGQYLDSKKLKELIYENISEKEVIELPILKSNPVIYSEAFEGINGLLAEFSTNYSKSEDNRKDNIDLGASKFNDKIVKPGEEVSFNDTVGAINSLTGFKDAGVIVNGEFDRGVGGGICQVSTTLYNALVRADLEITERHNHTRPISYVPLGTDAAVVEGYKNLKFRNNLKNNIYIKVFTDRKEIKFQIFGNKDERNYQVEIVPKLLDVIEPKVITQYSKQIPEGETEIKKKGAKGYRYATYKDIIKDGQVVGSEKISSSNYISRDEVIVVGEGDPELLAEKAKRNNSNNTEHKEHSN